MAKGALAIPVVDEEATRNIAKEMAGARSDEHDEARRRAGITGESAWYQHTPMGDLLVLHFEGKSPEEAFAAFGADNSAFGQWFKDQVKKAHGVDLTQPPPGPPPEQIFEWHDNS
jgi:hypothetical protein